jgi:hypothetical protein
MRRWTAERTCGFLRDELRASSESVLAARAGAVDGKTLWLITEAYPTALKVPAGCFLRPSRAHAHVHDARGM